MTLTARAHTGVAHLGSFHEVQRSAWALDPRTRCLLVVLASAVILAPGGGLFVSAAILLGMLLAASEGAWRRVVVLPAIAAGLMGLAYGLPLWWEHPLADVLAVLSGYLVRFTAIGGIGMHLAKTTSPGELTAALRSARLPRAIYVPAAVMLRFSPVVLSEARAVLDAMRLRGLLTVGGVLRHPILALERLIVPLTASSLRAADDLSASSLLRGLGARSAKPTVLTPLKFTRSDALFGLLVAALVAGTLGVRFLLI